MRSRKIIGTVLSMLVFTGISVIAFGQEDYSIKPQLYEEESGTPSDAGLAFASSDRTIADCGGCGAASCCQPCCPRWIASADVLIMDRVGGKSQTIIGPIEEGGADILNTDDFAFGFRAGPRLSLIRRGDRCFDLELLYFMIDGWNSSQVVDPVGPFVDPINVDWGSRLYNAELNLRWNPLCYLTVLAGFRWAELKEDFNLATSVIQGDYRYTFLEDFQTDNNLYGFQIGADAKIFEYGCFSVDGLLKAGIYNNRAERTSTLSLARDGDVVTVSTTAATDHAAFIGELSLQGYYQLTKRLTLKGGYQVMWIDGVALAPSQIGLDDSIDSQDTVFYHGATAGLEYSF
jgi:hypothetical protein